jgi:glycosyltransferase involved in cell wall biosynthesis
MALGKPVVAYAHGGVAEQLRVLFPAGLVPVADIDAAEAATLRIINEGGIPSPITPFSLAKMLDATLSVYQELASPA